MTICNASYKRTSNVTDIFSGDTTAKISSTTYANTDATSTVYPDDDISGSTSAQSTTTSTRSRTTTTPIPPTITMIAGNTIIAVLQI